MAPKSLRIQSSGFVVVNLKLNDRLYPAIHLTIMKDLCCDVLLGRNFQCQHLEVIFIYSGHLPEQVTRNKGCYALEATNMVGPNIIPKYYI